MRKGDRVMFFHEDENPKYGVVLKGGKNKNTVILDGGKEQISGGAGCFELSNHPLPVDAPSVMDKYSIASYKNSGFGEEMPQFNAEIMLNGSVIMTARNSGQGGCNMYTAINHEVSDQFEADAEEWGKQFGYPFKDEANDTWVEWAAREKIYGVLAVDYFKNYAPTYEGDFKLL